MTTTLLQTKLNIPTLRPALVPRPQLLEKLQAGLSGKLTLVSAPPGFGKTTLVSSWIRECGRPVAWVSLDDADNEVNRFLVYLTTALQQIGEGAGERARALLQSSGPPPAETTLTLLVNDFSTLSFQAILVLEDYHVIHNLDIHKALGFLLTNLPPQLHLAIVSREDPPLPLHQLRSRAEMNGVYIHDLRFTDEEAARFLQQTMNVRLDAGDISVLARRTEGWVAGLQLAALSLQDLADPGRFVVDFAGDDRYIADYLLNEVIERQPAEVRAFLLKTALLDRFTAPLCDAVIGSGDEESRPSRAIIEALDRSNLFVISLDGKREWYRYHHLFADFLRLHLHRWPVDEIAGLHRRAAAWYEQNGLFFEAIDHALAGDDFLRAGRLMEEHALTTIFERAQWSTLFKWMHLLPPETIRARPQLNLSFAWALYATGRWAEVEPYLHEVDVAFGEGRWQASQESILGEVATIRAMVAFELGDLSRSKALADLALRFVPESNKTVHLVATLAQGMAHLWDEDAGRLHRRFANAAEIARATGNVTVGLFALGFRTMLAVHQGWLQQASEFYRQTVTVGTIADGILYGPAGFACVQMGEVLREWNRLEEAETLLLEGVKLCQQQTGMPIWVVEGHVNLARLKLATGDEEQAEKMMQKAEALMGALPEQGVTMRRFLSATQGYRLRYWLARGKTDAALRWLDDKGIAVDSTISPGDEMLHLLLARILIAQDKLEEAGSVLLRLAQHGTLDESLRLDLENSILQALWRQARGESDRAVAMVSRALRLAEPEGYVRLFVDYGEPVARLLRQAAAQRNAPTSAEAILAAMGEHAAQSPELVALSEPLSQQELRMLRLMAAGCTNREIADELYLSVNTIKVYASRLYAKLGVHRRAEAVARARAQALGLR